MTYGRNYLSKKKFRGWYNQHRSSSSDSSKPGRNRDESLHTDNAQELGHGEMNLRADYCGPEDPGRNSAFMTNKDKDGDRIMIIQINRQTFCSIAKDLQE